jgi:hypothetical protein
MDYKEKIKSPESSMKISELSFEERLELQKMILETIKINEDIFSKKELNDFRETKRLLSDLLEKLELIEEETVFENEPKIEDNGNILFGLSSDLEDLKKMSTDGGVKISEIKNISKKIKNKINLYEKRI